MKNGCILNGGVGSGKSITSVAYYYLQCGGCRSSLTGGHFVPLKKSNIIPLYIITTARKRDTAEWEKELSPFGIFSKGPTPIAHIDSWNNIKKYQGIKDAFFIFDEQRVVGSGAWVKAFLKITKKNRWILLSATPGDSWIDYVPVFVANGYFRTRTEFFDNHVIFNPHTPYRQIQKYYDTGRLLYYRNQILIKMNYKKKTVLHPMDIPVMYDIEKYTMVNKRRWNPYENKPIENASEFCQCLRRIVNTDDSRLVAFMDIIENHDKVIVFYTYNYEREIIKNAVETAQIPFAEWNGFSHQPIPSTNRWVYAVQYTAGCEGWNCTETDTMIFYDQSYSYKVMNQAGGRIDRQNTPFTDLYYYHLKSKAPIDLAISRALKSKKQFNESNFYTKKEFSYEKTEKAIS